MNEELKKALKSANEMYDNDFKGSTQAEVLKASQVFDEAASKYKAYTDEYKSRSKAALDNIQSQMEPMEQLSLELDGFDYPVTNKEKIIFSYRDKDSFIKYLEDNFPLAVKIKTTKDVNEKVVSDLIDAGSIDMSEFNKYVDLTSQLTLNIGKPKTIKQEEEASE